MAKTKPSLHRNDDVSSTAKGTGKRPKHFLEQKEELALAASIAGVQEGKTLSRAGRHRQPQPGDPRPDRTTKTKSSSRERIKDKKAVLIAQRAQAKKDKAKQRKTRQPGGQKVTLSTKSNLVRKRVSFA